MHTQLDIDIDVLEELEKISARTKQSTGEIVSQLLRRNLRAMDYESIRDGKIFRNGFEIMPANGRVVTPEFVRQLIEETEDE